MFSDSQVVMPWAINSVRRDGVRDYLPAASPLIITFYLADAGGDIKSEKYVSPEGVDASLVSNKEHHSLTRFTNAQIRRKPETSKDRDSPNDFLGENYCKDMFVMLYIIWERAKLLMDMIWQAVTSTIWLTEHTHGFVRLCACFVFVTNDFFFFFARLVNAMFWLALSNNT